MITQSILTLTETLTTEDRIHIVTTLLSAMIEGDDFDVALALFEKKYQLAADPERKRAVGAMLKFIREINTLRPHAKEFLAVVRDQLGQREKA